MGAPDAEWFLAQMAASGPGSLRQVAQAINMTHSALSLAIHGQRHLRLGEAAALARVIDQPFLVVVRRLGVRV